MPKEEPIASKYYDMAGELLGSGTAPKQAQEKLVQAGLDRASAARLIKDLSAGPDTSRKEAISDMIVGALTCILGVGITWATYVMASGGGTYVIAFGAIGFGLLKFLRGFAEFTTTFL